MLAASGPGELFGDVLPWLGALALLVAIGALVIWAIRRWIGRDEPTASEGFTLHELREMHAAGTLTDEEYERAKRAIIGRASPTDEIGTSDEQADSG